MSNYDFQSIVRKFIACTMGLTQFVALFQKKVLHPCIFVTTYVVLELRYMLLLLFFNSKTLFKDGDPIRLQLIFPGAIQTCKQYNICSYIYTKQHRFNGQTQANTTYTFLQKTYTYTLILNLYNVYTIHYTIYH